MTERWEQEWEAQVGAVPPLARELHDLSPTAENAYRTSRADLFTESEDGLTRAEKELVLLVMNITLGNTDGALNHLRLARQAGLSDQAVREVLAECVLYLGVISHVRVGQVLWRECSPGEDKRSDG
jgi:alkylhydroperoxidase/carboxymuconolactone decarboxylase family protein YurZ